VFKGRAKSSFLAFSVERCLIEVKVFIDQNVYIEQNLLPEFRRLFGVGRPPNHSEGMIRLCIYLPPVERRNQWKKRKNYGKS
jgi:hypothetical protein